MRPYRAEVPRLPGFFHTPEKLGLHFYNQNEYVHAIRLSQPGCIRKAKLQEILRKVL
jgi:hypothetical protein